MSLTGEQLTDEVRAMVGRDSTSDEGVITDARVARWLNEAQRDIAEKCLGLDVLQFDSTSLTYITDDMTYDIGDITFGDSTAEDVLHIHDLWHLDGANSIKLAFMPTDEFDFALIDPTSSDHSNERPTRWTHRGNNIEVAIRPSSTYNGDTLRVTGSRYPAEFGTNDATASELPHADDGMIYYAVAEAWAAIGGPNGEAEATKWRRRYSNPHPATESDYAWLEDYADHHSRMESWPGNLYFTSEEWGY